MNKYRILVADDHELMRSGLKALISSQPNMSVVGEAADGEEAVCLAKKLQPDLVVVDISMPRCPGSRATEQIKEMFPGTKVVVLTMHQDLDYLRLLLVRCGASGYILKSSAAEELIRAINAVLEGKCYIDPLLKDAIINDYANWPSANLTTKLSDKEAKVLRMVAWGKTNKQISPELGISSKTVQTYRFRGMRKLGLKTRDGLVNYAAHHGWLQNPLE
jgi:two-component system, NarL family, response regulator NreC